MKVKTILGATTLALVGWFTLASASPLDGPARPAVTGYQLAQDEHHDGDHHDADHHDQVMREHHDRDDQWYQGQRGHWTQERNKQWRWRGAEGDQWYQGQQGHWYQQEKGWQFQSQDLICNDQGRNCHRGGYLAANGEGMVSRSNPSMFWQCDSHGHNCHWARRPGQ